MLSQTAAAAGISGAKIRLPALNKINSSCKNVVLNCYICGNFQDKKIY
jgi:hypothetical protein